MRHFEMKNNLQLLLSLKKKRVKIMQEFFMFFVIVTFGDQGKFIEKWSGYVLQTKLIYMKNGGFKWI